jgi:SAM-dependent methyltransferase
MNRQPDVHFTPVPDRVLAEMLRISAVGAEDVIYDLGCGDGRVLIAAAHEYGARGVGVDIDPDRIAEALTNVRNASLSERIECRLEDFFTSDLRPATVVALYLLDSLNVRLRPKILAECRPGTRVVSYSFEMGEWECDAHTPIAANGVSLWVVPANLEGRWVAHEGSGATALRELQLGQTFQKLAGIADIGGERRTIRDGRVRGETFELRIEGEADAWLVSGQIEGDSMRATIRGGDCESSWSASRER